MNQGVCISSEQDSFDFHFTHNSTEADNYRYEVHSRFCFRSDLIKFLEENGQLPPLKLDEVATMIKRERELVHEKQKLEQYKQLLPQDLVQKH